MTITFENAFHATSTTARPRKDSTISVATYARVKRALCGLRSCDCGGVPDGRWQVDTFQLDDARRYGFGLPVYDAAELERAAWAGELDDLTMMEVED